MVVFQVSEWMECLCTVFSPPLYLNPHCPFFSSWSMFPSPQVVLTDFSFSFLKVSAAAIVVLSAIVVLGAMVVISAVDDVCLVEDDFFFFPFYLGPPFLEWSPVFGFGSVSVVFVVAVVVVFVVVVMAFVVSVLAVVVLVAAMVVF